MWLQSREVHSGHNLLPPTAAEEVSRAAVAIVPRFPGPHQSLRLGEKKRALPDPAEDWVSSQILAVTTSFHQYMQSTVCFDGATSDPFPVSSGVKQGCVLAPTLFGIFFSMLLQDAFADCAVRLRRGKMANSSTSPDSAPTLRPTRC